MNELTPLRQRLQEWRAAKMAAAGITPLRFTDRALVPRCGLAVRDEGGWIVTQSGRRGAIIWCAALVGLDGARPIWAVFDEGRDVVVKG